MTRTVCPCSASAAPRLTAVVLLPTPPFWLAMAMTRTAGAGCLPFDLDVFEPSLREAAARTRGGFADAAADSDRADWEVTSGP